MMRKRFASSERHGDKGWTGSVRAVDVGRRLRLVPYWECGTMPGDRIEIRIDPGPSFGAGDHPTTLMALELLERAVSCALERGKKPSLLDVGTGTGVLAMAAKLLGTGSTIGLDIDGASVFAARRNFKLNNLDETDEGPALFLGGVEAVRGVCDIVAANLVGPVLLRLHDELVERVGSFLVLSGMADPVASQVLQRFGAGPLRLLVQLNREGWNAGLFERPA